MSNEQLETFIFRGTMGLVLFSIGLIMVVETFL